MNEMKHNPEELYHLLDSSLAGYSQAEPRAGLEERILANLRTAPVEESNAWAGWHRFAWAVVVIVFMASFGIWISSRSKTHSQTVSRSDVATVPGISIPRKNAVPAVKPTRETIARQNRKINSPRRTAVKQEAVAKEPRPSVFPTPVPLSEQERMALSYSRISRRVAMAVTPETGIRELEVEPLSIEPLRVKELWGAEKQAGK